MALEVRHVNITYFSVLLILELLKPKLPGIDQFQILTRLNCRLMFHQIVHRPITGDKSAAQEFSVIRSQPDSGPAHQLWRIECKLFEVIFTFDQLMFSKVVP